MNAPLTPAIQQAIADQIRDAITASSRTVRRAFRRDGFCPATWALLENDALSHAWTSAQEYADCPRWAPFVERWLELKVINRMDVPGLIAAAICNNTEEEHRAGLYADFIVRPCGVWIDPSDGTTHVEEADPEEAEFFSVYAVDRAGFSHCLEDFDFAETAIRERDRLRNRIVRKRDLPNPEGYSPSKEVPHVA